MRILKVLLALGVWASMSASASFVQVKPGVDLKGLQPEMNKVITSIHIVYKGQGADHVVITSGLDGKHMENSRHYVGYALDIRIWNLTDFGDAREHLQKLLGNRYRVILEADHFHIEYKK